MALLVNAGVSTIPSTRFKPGDVIEVAEKQAHLRVKGGWMPSTARFPNGLKVSQGVKGV